MIVYYCSNSNNNTRRLSAKHKTPLITQVQHLHFNISGFMCLMWFCVLSFQLKEEILSGYTVIVGAPRKK